LAGRACCGAGPAQGVTTDATHAVLGNTTRSLLYVALTRGRDAKHRVAVRAAC
jgi:hypothetical protein